MIPKSFAKFCFKNSFKKMIMNNQKIYPAKLKAGDEVRIIAPSRSLAIISEEVRRIANKRFSDLGLKISFGKHVE